ncbi:MAG: Hpt domain-containing protein [Proteobacteria bacterium]|nr:Hpt domain-containing protein [Pseudomonadota bacterium]
MIDWTRVADLRHEIGDDGFAEVVDLFLDEVEEVVARLEARPDPARLEEDLHFLKGSAWNLGFADFGARCHEAERSARPDLRAALESYRNSRVAFLAGLESLREAGTPNAA